MGNTCHIRRALRWLTWSVRQSRDIHSLPYVCTKQTVAYSNCAMGYYSMYILLRYHSLRYHSLPGLH